MCTVGFIRTVVLQYGTYIAVYTEVMCALLVLYVL